VVAVKAGSELFATLIVIRGNSASDKGIVAAGIRARCGSGIAIVGQDHLRRVVLKEKDRPGSAFLSRGRVEVLVSIAVCPRAGTGSRHGAAVDGLPLACRARGGGLVQ